MDPTLLRHVSIRTRPSHRGAADQSAHGPVSAELGAIEVSCAAVRRPSGRDGMTSLHDRRWCPLSVERWSPCRSPKLGNWGTPLK